MSEHVPFVYTAVHYPGAGWLERKGQKLDTLLHVLKGLAAVQDHTRFELAVLNRDGNITVDLSDRWNA